LNIGRSRSDAQKDDFMASKNTALEVATSKGYKDIVTSWQKDYKTENLANNITTNNNTDKNSATFNKENSDTKKILASIGKKLKKTVKNNKLYKR
jgi:hypothetical protein